MGYRNKSGLPDPTAFEAISNIRRIEKKEKTINKDNIPKIARGDIFIVKNQNAYGHEQNNNRPAIIVSNDLNNKYSSTVEVVYLTTKGKKDLPTHVSVVGRMMSKALCEQITTVDKSRIGDFVRTCTEKEMKEIDKAIVISLGLAKKDEDLKMTANEYQKLAARTMNKDCGKDENKMHALHGMVSEIGELHGIYQKTYQGHTMQKEHAQKELGDLLWFIAEYCTAMDWELEEIMQMNIDKLKARYPEGFSTENSLHRKVGDI